jgi:hypothetical protein
MKSNLEIAVTVLVTRGNGQFCKGENNMKDDFSSQCIYLTEKTIMGDYP